MMREVIASISMACSAVKNSSFGAVEDCAAARAWVAAESSAGQCAEIHTALRLLHERKRKSRRSRSMVIEVRDTRLPANVCCDSSGVKGKRRIVEIQNSHGTSGRQNGCKNQARRLS